MEMTPMHARITIAKHLMFCLLTEHDIQWEDWPDIGQTDWEDIDYLVRDDGKRWRVTKEELDKAYKVLSDRADHG